jgi:hypothetical protein
MTVQSATPPYIAAGDDHAAASLQDQQTIAADHAALKANVDRLKLELSALQEKAAQPVEPAVQRIIDEVQKDIDRINVDEWYDDETEPGKGILVLRARRAEKERFIETLQGAEKKQAVKEAADELAEAVEELKEFEEEHALLLGLNGTSNGTHDGPVTGTPDSPAQPAASPSQILESLTPNLEPAVSQAAAERAKADQARYDGPPCSQDLRGALLDAGFTWKGAAKAKEQLDEAKIAVLLDDYAYTHDRKDDLAPHVEAFTALSRAGWQAPMVHTEAQRAAMARRVKGMSSDGRAKLELFTAGISGKAAESIAPATLERLKTLGFTSCAPVPLPDDVEELDKTTTVDSLLDEWEQFRDGGKPEDPNREDREHCLASLGWKAPEPKAEEPEAKPKGKGKKAAARPADGAKTKT